MEPILFLFIVLGCMALIGILLCIFSSSNSNRNAIGLSLMFGAAVGFLFTGILYS